jgi:hypothetical protein
MKNLAWVTALSSLCPGSLLFRDPKHFPTLGSLKPGLRPSLLSSLSGPGVTDLPSPLFPEVTALSLPSTILGHGLSFPSHFLGHWFLFPFLSFFSLSLSSPVLGHCPSLRRSLLSTSPLPVWVTPLYLFSSVPCPRSLFRSPVMIYSLSFFHLSWVTALPIVCHCYLLALSYRVPRPSPSHLLSRTAKTKYRNFETNIPRKGISGSQSQFPHSYVCERFIYSHDRSPDSAGGNI